MTSIRKQIFSGFGDLVVADFVFLISILFAIFGILYDLRFFYLFTLIAVTRMYVDLKINIMRRRYERRN